VVSINDDGRTPMQGLAFGNAELAPEKWEDEIPEWLAALTPRIVPEEAVDAAKEWVQCAKELRQRTAAFVQQAQKHGGVPCRLLDQAARKARPATYGLDEAGLQLRIIQDDETPATGSSTGPSASKPLTCLVGELRNIWVCADSPLARRVHASLLGGGGAGTAAAAAKAAELDLACLVLLDAPAGPIGLFLRSIEAREAFLDGMAVLISRERLRCEPSLARCDLPGGLPPPEAQLRPTGRSLQSMHLSGPICAWLARVGEDVFRSFADDWDSDQELGAGRVLGGGGGGGGGSTPPSRRPGRGANGRQDEDTPGPGNSPL